ncbi:MAG: ComF family protein [Clostridiales bacterium]|nr:ComF family protein [Clostridiales bacterium]
MSVLDLIFPKDLYCAACSRPLPSQDKGSLALCAQCAGEIDWVTGRACEKCGKPLSGENPKRKCRECDTDAEHVFRKGYACAMYAGNAAELVRDMKYRSKSWHADTLAALMAARYFSIADPETGELPYYDYVMPVPMSAKKKSFRGYDQAALLARGLSRKIGVPYLGGALMRVRETSVMSSLSGDERRQNLEGAFAVSCDMINIVAGKSLLLADDVYTTGSSADACTDALLDAGAESVDVFVFATGADVPRAEDRPAVVESPSQLRAKGPT